MKYNKEYSCEEIIRINKTKYLFIGFIVGIIPFILLISILSLKEGGIKFIPSILRDTIIIFGIITACINSITLKNRIINKIETS
ncbi:MAG: hypothetical protein OSJ65_05510 [Bacilli bacterium]|nr:hypothetical protein [Bacilli bacterium]